MARRFFIVAAMAVLALILSGETFADDIFGTVFWDEGSSDDGSADIMVLCLTPANDTLMTSTNCCGEYLFEDLPPTLEPYKVWAHHIYHVVDRARSLDLNVPKRWKRKRKTPILLLPLSTSTWSLTVGTTSTPVPSCLVNPQLS